MNKRIIIIITACAIAIAGAVLCIILINNSGKDISYETDSAGNTVEVIKETDETGNDIEIIRSTDSAGNTHEVVRSTDAAGNTQEVEYIIDKEGNRSVILPEDVLDDATSAAKESSADATSAAQESSTDATSAAQESTSSAEEEPTLPYADKPIVLPKVPIN